MLAHSFPIPATTDVPVGEGRQLLLTAWRHIVLDEGACPRLDTALRHACGADADIVLTAVCGFLCALGHTRRRRLQVAWPGCPQCTADEASLLQLLAAAQAGDQGRFDAHLRWLARAELRPVLAHRAQVLARALIRAGLPVRAGRPARH